MTVRWSPLALERVAEIGERIALDRPTAAVRIVEGLFDAVERLTAFPLSGRQVPEFDRPDLREIIYEQYRIVYRTHGNRIDILTVRHTLQLMDDADFTD